MIKHLPNALTLLNLMCGTTAIVFSIEGNWRAAVFLILLAALFDFFDGLAARLLKAYSDIGKQLDSLADMVSFGVLPAIMLYLIYQQLFIGDLQGVFAKPFLQWIVLATVLIIPAFSAIRLARFNTAEGEGTDFLGLATPAHALFWTGIYWQIMKSEQLFQHDIAVWFIWIIHILLAFQMIIPIPMFSLKFESYVIKGNIVRYFFLIISIVILAVAGISGLPLIIIIYILLSLINLLLAK